MIRVIIVIVMLFTAITMSYAQIAGSIGKNSGFPGKMPIIGGLGTGGAAPVTGALLLEDGVSFLLLEDGTSNLCLEGGC